MKRIHFNKTCLVDGCPNKPKNRGWCNKHYLRWYFHGDPTFTKIAERGSGCIIRLKNRPQYQTKLIYADCPFRGKSTLIREHIWIAEQQIIHRQLRPNECVHHKDENPLNNAPSNLQVMTRGDHIRLHRSLVSFYKDGTPKGEYVHNAILTDKQVMLILKTFKQLKPFHGYKAEFCRINANAYRVKPSTIKNIIYGSCWRHVITD